MSHKNQCAKTFINKNFVEPLAFDFCLGEIGLMIKQSPLANRNEDAVGFVELNNNSGVIALADGAGGHPMGDQAAKIAIETVMNHCSKENITNSKLRNIILDSFERANEEIIALNKGAGTTLIVIEMTENLIRTYHAGDSLAFIYSQRGRKKFKTIGHCAFDMAVESGLIEEENNSHQQLKHDIKNLLGDREFKIEIGPEITFAAHDTLLVGSDGVFDNLSEHHLEETVKKEKNGKLVANIYQQVHSFIESKDPLSKPDDFSLITFRMKNR